MSFCAGLDFEYAWKTVPRRCPVEEEQGQELNQRKEVLMPLPSPLTKHPDKLKIRKHRLGANEGAVGLENARTTKMTKKMKKNPEASSKKQRKGPERGRFDELDMVDGSDSEGHEWKLGEVDSDDDSDLDSDEAFGESDEEKFAGFGFSGSSSQKTKKPKPRANDVNLDEDDEDDDSGSELEEGDLGEDAVDLATMLDDTEESDENTEGRNDRLDDAADSTDGEEDGDESEETDDESSASSADEDETSDQAKHAELQTSSPICRRLMSPTKQQQNILAQMNLAGPLILA